jgi:outer membrane protein assembly factor BamB
LLKEIGFAMIGSTFSGSCIWTAPRFSGRIGPRRIRLAALTTALFLLGPAVSPAQSSGVAANTDEQRAADGRPSEVVETADWPLPRGNAESTGFSPQSLADSLTVRWEFSADEAIESTPIVVGERVFVADVMGKVYAIGRADGKPIWTRDFETGFLAAPAVRGEQLVIGDVEGNLYALDVKTGRPLWKQTTEGEINGAAAFHGQTVLVTSQDGKLYGFSAQDGTPAWTYQTQDQIRCNPTLAGDRTFLGGCDGQLHVVNVVTGQADGEPLPLDGPTGSTPAVRGDRVFVPIMDGTIYAFDWKTRKPLWSHEDPERPQEYRNSGAVSDTLLVVSSQFKNVDALSIETGKRLWRHTLRRRADASPVIAGDDVWVASTDGRLIRLSVQDGSERWQYEVRGAFLAAPAIAGGQLFIADDRGVVRCFGPAG